MDALKALKALKDKLKQDNQSVVGGNKYVKRSVVEEAKLKRLRDEEEKERQEKEKRRKVVELSKPKHDEQKEQDDEKEEVLPKVEIVRRLRALGQPATLFGEDDVERFRRLVRAEKDMNVEDESKGGQGENSMLEMQKQEKLNRGKGDGKEKEAKEKVAAEQKANDAQSSEPKDPLQAAFEAAAAKIAEQRAEEQMSIEERISRHLKRWCKEWEADMDARPEEVKNSGPGNHATRVFKQTMLYFGPLHQRLRRSQVDEELRNGIWMMVRFMRDRNYLAAYDVYLKLAIGNAPWPIGVTSVGIHERSAREKISHVMNVHGQAHIMNDEATRKYLSAMKRLITFVQRVHPTDPSRSVDFSTVADASRGAAGGGSDKLALLEAERTGNDWQTLGLPAPPHFLEKDGTVKVPPKWENILSRALESEPTRNKTPPLTTPPPTPPRGKTPPTTPPQASTPPPAT